MQTFSCSRFYYLMLDNVLHSRITCKTNSRCILFRAVLYIYYKVIHARKTTHFAEFLFFFCASRRTLRKLQHYRPKFTQPGLPIVTPCVSAFSSMFESQKASFRAESLSLSFSLSPLSLSLPFPLSLSLSPILFSRRESV